MVVTPVVAFYLLYDWNRMVATVDNWIPLQHRETVHGLAREMDEAIAGFVRGQTGVCLILGSFYAVSLTLTGLSFGLLIGLVSGIITFIPYVGSMTGLVLAAGVAVAQFWPNYTPILLVLGIFFVGQFLEGYVLAPKLVGESVGLHPVWLMFALFAFGYLFGFVGLLIAVPLAAVIGVLVRFALRRYLESPFYTGEPATGPVGFTAAERAGAGPSSMNVPRQLALALPHAESFAREDFLTGAPNEAALAMIERWPDWPDRALALVGPEGAGKSHLAAIWAEIAGARRVSARALGETNLLGALATGALVVEDAPARLDERALFHLLNLMREEEAFLLITARTAPAQLERRAARSRVAAARASDGRRCSAPDDALLRAVLVKLFADRQLARRREPGRLSDDPHRALVRGRARGGRGARPRGAAAEAPGHARAGGGVCCATSHEGQSDCRDASRCRARA